MRAHLIDLSKYQVFFDPNAVTGPLDGVIIRAGYGLMKDKKFIEFTISAQSIPVRGAYHYFSSAVPWKSQAQFFIQQVTLEKVENREFHFYALDIESAFNSKSAGFALGAQQWMQYVAEHTGKKVLLYTNNPIYKDWLLPYGDWMKAWPLWIAQWPYSGWNSYLENIRANTTIQPGLPRGITDWSFWQYSSPGNNKGEEYGVASRDIDLNVFNGTVAELHTWAGIESEIPVPVPDPPPPNEPLPPPIPSPNPPPTPSGEPQGCLPAVMSIIRSRTQS